MRGPDPIILTIALKKSGARKLCPHAYAAMGPGIMGLGGHCAGAKVEDTAVRRSDPSAHAVRAQNKTAIAHVGVSGSAPRFSKLAARSACDVVCFGTVIAGVNFIHLLALSSSPSSRQTVRQPAPGAQNEP